jgi:hypothetical protein
MLLILPLIPISGKLAPIGAISLVATMALMAYSASKGMEGK